MPRDPVFEAQASSAGGESSLPYVRSRWERSPEHPCHGSGVRNDGQLLPAAEPLRLALLLRHCPKPPFMNVGHVDELTAIQERSFCGRAG